MNQKGLAPIAIVLILAVLVGGYLIYQQQANTTAPQSSTTQDETANWKSYSNKRYSYSLKYPSNYSALDPELEPSILTGEEFMVSFVRDITLEEAQKYRAENGVKREVAFYNYLGVIVQEGRCPQNLSHATSSKSVKVDGVEAKEYRGSSPTFADPQYGDSIIYVNKNNYCYHLAFLRDPNNLNSSEEIYNQILSTFKFTERSKIIPSTAALEDALSWNTYTFSFERYNAMAAKYTAQFRYPSGWMVEEVKREKTNIQDCIEYRISSEDKNVQITIKSFCNAYTAKYSPFPEDGIVIKKRGKADDLSDVYVVRTFDGNLKEYQYIDVLVPEGSLVGDIDNEATDSLVITPESRRGHDSIFTNVGLRYSGPESKKNEFLKQADTVIHSLNLK